MMEKLPESLPLRFILNAKRRWSDFAMADSTGKELTYGKTLIGSRILARFVNELCPDDRMVGIMLPPTVGGVLSNIAVALTGKVPVNLNFTAGRQAIGDAIEQCKIKVILTSRTFLEKANLAEIEGMVFLEDLLPKVSVFSKLLTAIETRLLPPETLLGLDRCKNHAPDELAAIIFSSGSTGMPKGIMLSQGNVLAVIEGISKVYRLTEKDRIMGILPLFHSFGFTATVWLPLIIGFSAVYHPKPMDSKIVGELVKKYEATLLVSTPTFYAGYIRKCSKEEFASLRLALSGAEKLRESVARAFAAKFGLDLMEGYGATEMAPGIAVTSRLIENCYKPGSVGRPLPGVEAKVVDRETGEGLPTGKEGLLLVKGKNRMVGYLNNPELTAQVFRGEWYVTGDIAALDEEGFIKITDRLSRFSKIAGEMVPHMKVEEAINEVLNEDCCAVTGVPDEKKGERLVVLYAKPDAEPEEICEKLGRTDLPKLWIPRRDCFFKIKELPTLGTGKTDLAKLNRLARELSREKTAVRETV
jgi:acyl-[acyl-carrier-protein]-phospholipid O-acyltransferase/long-chain-fatty-acid--[acyl-carrier-protein] ligase